MQPFVPAPHDDIVQLLVVVAVLLVVARAFAELALRLGQPPVVGEILAGVLLGPSVLSAIPAVEQVLIPTTPAAGHLLEFVGMLGAMFLLLITGIETDLPLIRRHARIAIGIAGGGLFVPLIGGLLVALAVPDSLVGDPTRRGVFSLFLASALAVSAIPVVAKILLDLKLVRRTFGQTVLAAGMIDDTAAWILLSIVLALAAGPETSGLGLTLAAGRILLFIALAATVGRWIVDHALAIVQDRGQSADRMLTLVVALTLAFGAASHALGIEAILGAFVAGVIIGQNPRLSGHVVRRLNTMTLAVFSPVFFAIAGLKVNLRLLASADLILLGSLVLVVAVVGKVFGAYVGARLVGADHWSAIGYGAALNARGAVGIIIASIGLGLGILTTEMYAIVALVAIVTSLMAPGLVRFAVSRVQIGEEEGRRLRSEEASASGALGVVRRVLLPVKPQSATAPVHEFESRLVGLLGDDPSVTLLAVAATGNRKAVQRFLDEVAGLFPRRGISKRLVGGDLATAILAEAAKGYDLVVLGAPGSEAGPDVVFNPVVDAVARLAPCPTIVVSGASVSGAAWPPRRILVPTSGSLPSRRATQLAITIAAAAGASVTAMSVAAESPHGRVGAPALSAVRAIARATEIVAEVARLGAAMNVEVRTLTPSAAIAEEAILDTAVAEDVDLIVLGTGLNPGTTRLFLGPRVETILAEAACPVVVLNSI